MNLKKRKAMKTKTKQTTRTGTESENWTSYGGFSVGRQRGGMGGKVQGIRSIIGKHKIYGERLRMIKGTKKSKNLYVQPMKMN